MTLQDKLSVLNELGATYQRIKSVNLKSDHAPRQVEKDLLAKIETLVKSLGI